MKKLLLVLVSVLLLTGVAYASEWTSSLNAELSAQNTGRAVVTASSVVLQVYYRGTGQNPSFGVSGDSVVLYDDGAADVTVNTSTAATDTVEEIVSAINNDGDWVAVAGPDYYPGYAINGALIALNNSYTIGSNLASAGSFTADSSTTLDMTAGVQADPNARIRLKTISQQVASNLDNITIRVYDGDTLIWQKYIPNGSYISATGLSASPNTVIPCSSDKGLSTTKGNSLCVRVSTDGQFDTDATARAFDQVAITYDKLRD